MQQKRFSKLQNQLRINQPKTCLFEAHSLGNLCKYFALFHLQPQPEHQQQQRNERCICRIVWFSLLCSHNIASNRQDFTLEFPLFSNSIYYELWCGCRIDWMSGAFVVGFQQIRVGSIEFEMQSRDSNWIGLPGNLHLGSLLRLIRSEAQE